MPKKIELIETPNGTAKRCTVCGTVKLLHLFVKDDRYAERRGQPCSVCKGKMTKVNRLYPETLKDKPKSVPHKAKPRTANSPKLGRPPSPDVNPAMREAGIKGGAARAAAKDRADSHPKPPTPAAISAQLYAQAGRALKESWYEIDRELYERHIAMLDSSYPGKEGDDFQHSLFHAYAKGVIARYGG